jgi:hypothetical protein
MTSAERQRRYRARLDARVLAGPDVDVAAAEIERLQA